MTTQTTDSAMYDAIVTAWGEIPISQLPTGLQSVWFELPRRKDGDLDRRYAVNQDWLWAASSFAARKWNAAA